MDYVNARTRLAKKENYEGNCIHTLQCLLEYQKQWELLISGVTCAHPTKNLAAVFSMGVVLRGGGGG
jgi:hypothetical protein